MIMSRMPPFCAAGYKEHIVLLREDFETNQPQTTNQQWAVSIIVLFIFHNMLSSSLFPRIFKAPFIRLQRQKYKRKKTPKAFSLHYLTKGGYSAVRILTSRCKKLDLFLSPLH